jgi:ABC-type nitrate/sulfonate/bicarbonate transport system substrate-binding protein
MSTKKIFIAAVVVVAAIVIFLAWPKNEEKIINNEPVKELKKVTVQAGWLLNGEFANVCSAIVNGYYEEEGLDVAMLPGGPTGASFIVATNMVAQNPDIELGIDGDIIPLLRGVTKENENERLKVKAFAAFWNDNPYGFLVREDSGLTSLKDFVKTKPDGTKYKIGVTADSVSQYAIAKYAGVDVEDMDIVIVGFDATPLLAGQVDALAGYWTTQAYELEKAGIAYRFLSMSEIPGLKQPAMVAVASDLMLKNDSETLTKWLKATIKGSEYVVSNATVAANQILDPRCGGEKFDTVQEEWLIKKSIPLFDEDRIGWIYENEILDYAQAYYDLGQIPRVPEKDEVLDYSILNSIYK